LNRKRDISEDLSQALSPSINRKTFLLLEKQIMGHAYTRVCLLYRLSGGIWAPYAWWSQFLDLCI